MGTIIVSVLRICFWIAPIFVDNLCTSFSYLASNLIAMYLCSIYTKLPVIMFSCT